MTVTRTPVRNRIRVGSLAADTLIVVMMLLFCVVILYPFLHVIAISLSSNRMITQGMVSVWPREFTGEGYSIVFSQNTIYISYLWTLLYSLLNAVLSLSMSSMLAYPLSVAEFRLKKPISVLLLITMFFSGGTIPSYLLINKLGLMNTAWALTLPTCVSAYNIFLYRAFYKGISGEIREAARIDGAGDLRILLQIYLPLSKPLYATFALFAIVGMWNSYFSALLYIKDNARQPIQMILRSIMFSSGALGATFSDSTEMMAQGKLNPLNVQYACLVATLAPMVVIYPFIQKYFEQGMQLGAVKG